MSAALLSQRGWRGQAWSPLRRTHDCCSPAQPRCCAFPSCATGGKATPKSAVAERATKDAPQEAVAAERGKLTFLQGCFLSPPKARSTDSYTTALVRTLKHSSPGGRAQEGRKKMVGPCKEVKFNEFHALAILSSSGVPRHFLPRCNTFAADLTTTIALRTFLLRSQMLQGSVLHAYLYTLLKPVKLQLESNTSAKK